MSLVDFLNLDDTRLTLDELLDNAISAFSNTTQYNKIIVSYSGGKDSTVLAIAMCEAIKRGALKKEDAIIIFADTKMEIPALEKQIDVFLDFVENKFGVQVIRVARETHRSYWVRFLGEGTFAANHFARWCVKLIKIDPIKNAFKNLDKYLVAIGVRLDESTVRKEKYKNNDEIKTTTCDTAGECLVPLEDETRIFPILNWKNCNIWDFLMFHEVAQEYPVNQLRDLYFQRDTMRYGCWSCTVATDTELLKLHKVNDPKYELILEYRKNLWFYTSPKFIPQDWIYVWKIPGVNNTTLPKNEYLWLASRLTIKTRKRLLTELIQIQDKTKFNLISQEEIDLIKEKWIEYPDGDRKGRDWKYYDGPVQQQVGDYFE